MPLEDSREVPTPNRDRLEFRKCTRSLFLSFSFSLSLSLSRFFYPRNRITPVPRYVCTQRLPRYFISTKLRGLSQNTAVVHNPRQRFLNSPKPSFKYFHEDEWARVSFRKSPVAFSACESAPTKTDWTFKNHRPLWDTSFRTGTSRRETTRKPPPLFFRPCIISSIFLKRRLVFSFDSILRNFSR